MGDRIIGWFQDCRNVLRKRASDLSLSELSGSLGDLGTFLPLLLNLAAFHVVEFSPALFWAGFYNIVTGVMWDTPMPVQPMKTIAAVALGSADKENPGLTPEEAIGAGLTVSAIVLVLGLSGFIEVVNWFVPLPVIRGLQLGLGASMILSGSRMLEKLSFASSADSILLGLLSCTLVLAATYFDVERKVPSALVLSVVGFCIAVVRVVQDDNATFRLQPEFPPFLAYETLTWSDVWQGFLKAGLAQLPLTTLNSVVSVVDLNNKGLFPDEPNKHLTRRSVASSVAMMNLSGLWFGAMPMCHGAGGLAGQYRFGARTGSALLVLGFVKILVAVILGQQADVLLQLFPTSILASLLIFAGIGLALTGISSMVLVVVASDGNEATQIEKRKKDLFILIVTACFTLALKTGWGFVAGLIASVFYGGFSHLVPDCKKAWQRFRESRHQQDHVEPNASSSSSVVIA